MSILVLDGDIDMNSAAALASALTDRAAREDLCLDFAKVGNADSAALALILRLARAARDNDRRLTLRDLPAGLLSLARLYEIENLLAPLQENRA